MRHVPDGVLRRLVDEPLAVPDHDAEHVQRCRRCQEHRDRVARDAGRAHELVARPQPVPDLERAWDRLRGQRSAPTRHVPRRIRPRRLAGPTGVAVVSGVLVAGVAAAATLTVVFSPTHVAPLPVTRGDLQSLTSALGIGGSGLFGRRSASTSKTGTTSTGPATSANGTSTPTWAYGTIAWSTHPKSVKTTSLQSAEAAAGMAVELPATLPAGVQGSPWFIAVPQTSVTVTFNAAAGPSLAGSTLTLTLGPGVLTEYRGTSIETGALGNVPTLAFATMQRPTATSSGATVTQLEDFVLSRPGFPQDLADGIRLLGNLKDVLPVPVPSGIRETSTAIAGSPAVLLSADGGAATGVVWEHDGIVRTVGGLLDQQDVMDVARQLG
jgi:hypothetical protein